MTRRSARSGVTLTSTQSNAHSAPPPAKGTTERGPRVPIGLLTFITIIALWSALTYTGLLEPEVLPTPTALVAHFWTLIMDGYLGVSLTWHALASLQRTFTGFVLAVLVGVPVGVAMGHFPTTDRILRPILSFLRPIPPIAFIPLSILYLGLGETAKVVLIFFASFIFVIINAESGARATPEVLVRAARSMGLSSGAVFWRVVVPAAMPSILAGMRVALAVSWGVVVAAELIAAQSGLGYMIQSAGVLFDLETVYVGIIVIGLIGMALDTSVLALQRRVLHWQGK